MKKALLIITIGCYLTGLNAQISTPKASPLCKIQGQVLKQETYLETLLNLVKSGA